MKILVAICTHRGNSSAREGVRDSWLRDLPEGIDVMFFMGGKEPTSSDGDLLVLKVDDTYDGLPKKVHALFRYALEHREFDYLFKCDDDTYVVLERLQEIVNRNHDLVGDSNLRIGWPCGGAGYMLSRKAVEFLASLPEPGDGPEDHWVGHMLPGAGMSMVIDERLQGGCHRLPHSRNTLVTAHHCPPEVLRHIHRNYQEPADEVVRTFSAWHPDWQGEVTLFSTGIFIGGIRRPHGSWRLSDSGEVLYLDWFQWPTETVCRTAWGYRSDGLLLEDREATGDARPAKQVRQEQVTCDKLHLGCGTNKIEGWGNYDLEMDVRYPLPVATESMRFVFLEHLLEQLSSGEAWNLLKEIRRILKPGGAVRIVIPSPEQIAERFDAHYGRFVCRNTGRPPSLEAAMESILSDWGHRTVWSTGILLAMMKSLGMDAWQGVPGESRFSEMQGIDGHSKMIGDHPNRIESVVVEARKRN